jgi:indole-3-glycerol phosphate synthase
VNAGASIVGINNRDLRTFRISLNTSERLIAEAPRDKRIISESGLQSADSLVRLRKLGFRGFLVGEALLRAPDPETAFRNLVAAVEGRQLTAVSTGACQP